MVTFHAGPYPIAADPKPNLWRDDEFLTLERNTATSQAAMRSMIAALYNRQPGRLPNDPNRLEFPPSDADSQVSSLLYYYYSFEKKKSHRSPRLTHLTIVIFSLCHLLEVNLHR